MDDTSIPAQAALPTVDQDLDWAVDPVLGLVRSLLLAHPEIGSAMYQPSNSPVHLSPVRVLLIDDHPLVRAGYRYLLHCTRRLQVAAEASSAAAGYRRYLEGAIDVVVLDLSLPGAGGLEVLRRIRHRDEARKSKVLIVSMHDEPAMIERALALGANGYLCKRSNPEMLVEAVNAVARGETFIDPAYAKAMKPAAEAQSQVGLKSLNEREFEIFRQLAEGRSVDLIASSLSLSAKTVANYGTAIRSKLRLENRAAMARMAMAAGIVSPA
jgi:DNA-binding NarL/FixJ family response regulator